MYLSVNRSGENSINRLHRNFFSLPYTRNQHSSFVVFVGVCVSLRYFVEINYFPQGLTIGDTLFFIASSLAFATVYLAILGVLFCGGLVISPFFRAIQVISFSIFVFFTKRKAPKFKINFPILTMDLWVCVFLGLFSIFLAIYLYTVDFNKGLEYTVVTIVIGCLAGLMNTKPRAKKYDINDIRLKKAIVLVMIFASPLITFKSNSVFLKGTMELIGVRVDSSVIVLDKKHVDFFKALGKEPEKFISNGNAVYKDITILFRGIGSNVVIDLDGGNVVIPEKDLVVASKN